MLTRAEIKADVARHLRLYLSEDDGELNRLANEIMGLRSALALLAGYLSMLDWRAYEPGIGGYIEARQRELLWELAQRERQLNKLWEERRFSGVEEISCKAANPRADRGGHPQGSQHHQKVA